jgi:hypothetical protein
MGIGHRSPSLCRASSRLGTKGPSLHPPQIYVSMHALWYGRSGSFLVMVWSHPQKSIQIQIEILPNQRIEMHVCLALCLVDVLCQWRDRGPLHSNSIIRNTKLQLFDLPTIGHKIRGYIWIQDAMEETFLYLLQLLYS